ncbi:MAG: hypothetical protein WCT03_19285, partial [Candidatus Obscuribacterales bacterium]
MSAPKASSSSLVANSETKFNRSVTLIYCPIHLGGPHAGVALGPGAMKVARLVSRIKDLGYTVHKEVEISV